MAEAEASDKGQTDKLKLNLLGTPRRWPITNFSITKPMTEEREVGVWPGWVRQAYI